MKVSLFQLVYNLSITSSNLFRTIYNFQKLIINYIHPLTSKDRTNAFYFYVHSKGIELKTEKDISISFLMEPQRLLPSILLHFTDIDFDTKPRELKDVILNIRNKYKDKIKDIINNITKCRLDTIFDLNLLCSIPSYVNFTISDELFCKEKTKFESIDFTSRSFNHMQYNRLAFYYLKEGKTYGYVLSFHNKAGRELKIEFSWVVEDEKIESVENVYKYDCMSKKIELEKCKIKETLEYEREFLNNPIIDNLVKIFKDEEIKLAYGILNNILLFFQQYLFMIRDLIDEIVFKLTGTDVWKEICKIIL